MLLSIILAGLLFLAGFTIAAQGFLNLETLFTLEIHHTDQIRDLTPGLTEVSGNVRESESLLTAPISGEPCVCFSLEIREEHEYATGPEWEISERVENAVPFYLEDESGKILIDPAGAELQLPIRYSEHVPPGIVPPDPIRSTGEELPESNPELAKNIDRTLLICQTNRDTRFLESYVSPEDELTAFGQVMHREQGRNAFYDDRDTLLLYHDPSTPAFVLSDEPGSGTSSMTEAISIAPWFFGGGGLFVAGLLVLLLGI